jgi:hypothetical protein
VFGWHQHDDTDEVFVVLDGQPTIRGPLPAGLRPVHSR